MIAAAHSQRIKLLAVTEDGLAALTSDPASALRVWPALDGTREPIVVRGPTTVIDLAIAHVGDELAAAFVDQANTLTIVRLDRAGHQLGRVQLAEDVRQLEATPDGFVAVLADHTIAVVSPTGALARLPPTERVAALLYRNRRALVLHASSPKHVQGRWIELAGGAHWGDTTAELALDPKTTALQHAALSPDHSRLVVQGAGDRLLAIDLATTTATAFRICAPIGYLDDDTLACDEGGDVVYLDRKGKALASTELAGTLETVGIAGNQLAFPSAMAIALAAPHALHYVGYRSTSVTDARDTVIGVVVSAEQRFTVDATFALAQPITSRSSPIQILVPLSPTLQARLAHGEDEGDVRHLVVGERRVIEGVREDQIHFEPTTGLLAEAVTMGTTFVRISDSKPGPPLVLATSTSPLSEFFIDRSEPVDEVFLTDPALADGRVALVVHGRRVYEVRDADLVGHVKASKSFAVAEPVVAIDRRGQIYTHGTHDVVIHGTTTTFARTADAVTIEPSVDGALVAITNPTTIALFASDGTLRWRVPRDGVRLTWTHDGRLLAIAHGLATFDLETGELTGQRCGWNFGVSTTPIESNTQPPTVCDR